MSTEPKDPNATPHMGGFPAWCVWALATLFVIYLFNIQTGYSIVNPMMQKDVGLSLAQIGLVASFYTWVFAVCQFFGGALLDRLGSRRVIVPAVALVTVGLYVFATADSFAKLILSQIILAVGSCVGFVGAGYVGGKWFGMAKYGLMFGLVQTVASLSSAFGQTGIAIALHEMDWRNLALHGVYFGIGLFIVAALFVRDPAPPPPTTGSLLTGVGKNLLDVVKIPHIWIASLWGAACFGSQLAMGVVWAPKLLAAHGIGKQLSNLGSAMVWLGLAVGCLFWNGWSDHIRARRKPAIVGLAIQILALAILLWVPLHAPLGMAAMFLFGMGSAGHMIAFASAGDVVPPAEIGTSASVVNGAMFIVGGLLTALPGYLLPSDRTSVMADFRGAFLPILVIIVVALLLAVFQKESFPRKS